MFDFLAAGSPGTLNPPFVFAVLICVNVPPEKYPALSASLFLLSSACTFGSTSSRPWAGVKVIELAVPALTPLVRRP